MANYVYFDVLDTARTKLGGDAEQEKHAQENRFRGQAEIKMSLACGWIPIFPQTYGWDSSALLDFGSEESFVGASFFSLVRQGFIRILLRNHNSIWDAALESFQSPSFRHLSAWPEFNTNNPLEARRPLVETMQNWQDRNTKYSEALSKGVRQRLNLLRELSSNVPFVATEERELPRRNRVSNLIRAAASAANKVDPQVATLLSRCIAELPDPDNRTAIDSFLNKEEENMADRETENMGNLVPVVREVTNGCFNAVAAHCVRAHAALTLPRAITVAQDVLLRTLPSSIQGNLFEAGIRENEVSELKAVNWKDIDDLLSECRNRSATEVTRQAEGAKMIAKAIVDRDPQYVMKFEKKNSFYNVTVWASTALAKLGGPAGAAFGGMVGHSIAGEPGAIKGAAVGALVGASLGDAVVNGLAGRLTSRDIRKDEKETVSVQLEQKYRGLVETLSSTGRNVTAA